MWALSKCLFYSPFVSKSSILSSYWSPFISRRVPGISFLESNHDWVQPSYFTDEETKTPKRGNDPIIFQFICSHYKEAVSEKRAWCLLNMPNMADEEWALGKGIHCTTEGGGDQTRQGLLGLFTCFGLCSEVWGTNNVHCWLYLEHLDNYIFYFSSICLE